jgi:hypothetical protein
VNSWRYKVGYIHKNTTNVFAKIGNAVNSLLGGSGDYFVEHKPYDPVEDAAMQEMVAQGVGAVGGLAVGKLLGLGARGAGAEATEAGPKLITEVTQGRGVWLNLSRI